MNFTMDALYMNFTWTLHGRILGDELYMNSTRTLHGSCPIVVSLKGSKVNGWRRVGSKVLVQRSLSQRWRTTRSEMRRKTKQRNHERLLGPRESASLLRRSARRRILWYLSACHLPQSRNQPLLIGIGIIVRPWPLPALEVHSCNSFPVLLSVNR